ncbi:MAG: DEAD/DEAH box helicase [Candidatus Staskawiczbacteria bacterium]|nr:DEAD/DEAH box helicase [Candidatus Staskawiczbacteria bacterium]
MINNELNFGGLGIAPKLLEKLTNMGFKSPTPIQHKTIPITIEGKDVIGIAQTGTGKTLAFGVPMIQRILQSKTGKGLIVLPTRELAIQVDEALTKIGKEFGLKTAVLIGGASTYVQINALRANPHIVIGTPGRINDLILQRALHLHGVNILVLDEADRMFDMGFAPQIKKILQSVPTNRQTMLFSATMPDNIAKIASGHMKLPVRIEIVKQGTPAENVEHELFVVPKNQKMSLLKNLLAEYKGSVLVFIRAKHSAGKICRDLRNAGVLATEIHSNRSLNQRKEAMEGFKFGKYRVMVATDIASRGIDVKGIELVINYDLPENPEDYVHRIGRTGRAGMSGKAISFAMPDQGSKIREIERLTNLYLPIIKLPEGLHVAAAPTNNYSPQNNRNRNRYSRRR